uniref:U3 small nucleolar ribonucleoprotein protein MPP10 n=1 Tax=Strigamia maritima TaxID=126957 RepID=T1JF27_STRMM
MATSTLLREIRLQQIEECEANFAKYTKNPELFLGSRTKTAIGLLKIAKRVYGLYEKNDDDKKILPQLMINGFDDEQIWQQIEIDNSSCKNRLIKRVAELATRKRNRKRKTNQQRRKKERARDEDETESLLQTEEEEVEEKMEKRMEEFLEAEESKMDGAKQSDDESIDYFEGIASTDEDADSDNDVTKKRYTYDEFFEQVGEDDNGDEETFENENDASEDKNKSTIEIRQEKLKEKIQDLEEINMAEKPWQLMGEATASTRPENSLLQEHAMFDHVQRQGVETRPISYASPVITEETTQKLEDIIKQRIKDQVWNDVERKVKPKEEPFEYKKRVVLDQEKSKLSLAQVYENEYIKLQQTEKSEEESPAHVEIKKMMTSLFYKLDILCNFHFTPKPAMPELKIVNNLPAIVLEEVAPTTAATGTLLAPTEIMAPSTEKGEREKDKTDKLRERRLKKKFQSSRRKEREEHEKMSNVNPKENKRNKEKHLKELVNKVERAEMKDRKKTHLSSTATFKRLNEISSDDLKKVSKKMKNNV